MSRGRSLFWSIIAAVCGVMLLYSISEPLPHLATSDIYTHLTVTRHLAQGEGFVTDVTYPLSFAYPFAQVLPQPLIHRQPGFAILLQIPYATSGGDSHLVLQHVRNMQFVILGLIIVVGGIGYLRRDNGSSLLPWIVFLLANPLISYALDWGFVELVCSLILFVIWLRGRDVARESAGPFDGLLAGVLAMFRFDLFWVPWLWFLWWRHDRFKESSNVQFFNLKLMGTLLAFILVMAPWTIRNIQVSGQPFFSLQAQAELVKMTPAWPGYSVYKQLEPQPMLQTFQNHPTEVLKKVTHGLWFFLKEHHRFMPWLLFWAGAIPAIVFSFILIVKGLLLVVFRKRISRLRISPQENAAGPNMVAFSTLALICLQYSFFDHDLRHLLVLLPVLLWETTRMVGDYVAQTARRNTASWHSQINPLRTGFIGLFVAVVLILLLPCKLPGWENAAKEAVNQQPRVSQRVAWLRAHPEGFLFDETSAVPWFVNMPAIWTPSDVKIQNSIRNILAQKHTERNSN